MQQSRHEHHGAHAARPRPCVPAARARCACALIAAATLAAWSLGPAAGSAHALSADIQAALKTSRYVYIASKRKDGSFGKPAEIWFMYHAGAVWVASPPTTWRVRRIRAGRPEARISVGTSGGPTFTATGSIVADDALYQELFRTYARKYPEGWAKWEARFRSGLKDGGRVLIKYTPLD